VGDERYRLGYRVRYAIGHRDRVLPHLRRVARNLLLRARYRDHTRFYREVVSRTAASDPDLAIGSASRDRWLALGKLQFDYLVGHGLEPHHRMLEIGCGNLRAGWRFIDLLEPGNYHGVDASPAILVAAQRTLVDHDLRDKLPYLTPVEDLTLAFLPSGRFDVVHAHSVFSHTPPDVVEECFANVGRVMAPDGFFDLTFNATSGREHHIAREDFYYRPQTLIDLAASYGFDAEVMVDWSPLHKHEKLRLRRR